MHIGQIIRALRAEKGWSQEELAHEAGLTPSAISRVETGRRRLPTLKLEAIAAALGTSAAAVYARAEGHLLPASVSEDGFAETDYTDEAIQLRRLFRSLTADERQLVIDFAKMLLQRRKRG